MHVNVISCKKQQQQHIHEQRDDKSRCKSLYLCRNMLFCAMLWSFVVIHSIGWVGERERQSKDSQRARESERVCGGRVGPAPAHPTLATACRVKSAAFPEGNAEDRGRTGSLLLRSPKTKTPSTMQIQRTENRGGENRRSEKEGEREYEPHRSLHCDASSMSSTSCSYSAFTASEQKWE